MGKGFKPKPKPTYKTEKSSVNAALQNEISYLNSRFWSGRYKDVYKKQREVLLGKQSALDKLSGSGWLSKAKEYFGNSILGDMKADKRYIDTRPIVSRESGRKITRYKSGREFETDKKTGKVLKKTSGRSSVRIGSGRTTGRITSNRPVTRTSGR